MVGTPIDPKAKPCFFQVPYAQKDEIEHELEHLVKEGIYEPVASSKQAVTIVPIIKDDGSICICRNYKQTLHKIAHCDKYPIYPI